MERDLVILGTLIALLSRANIGLDIENQIFKGIQTAKQLSITESIVKEAGNEPTEEEAVAELSSVETTGSYQDIVSWKVSNLKRGELNKIELAADNYTKVQFRLTIGDKVVWSDKLLPNATTLTWTNLRIRGGRTTKIEAKSSDAAAYTAWGDITGKEVV